MTDRPEFLRSDVANPARIYDYWLGGRNNFRADREAAEAAIAANPMIVLDARANRRFLARAVTYLTEDAGIGQFLDVGSGLPTERNVHEVAQALAPRSRTVYVDNDPVVARHALSVLTSTPPGAAIFVQADLRDPATILAHASLTLDLAKPVALMLLLVLHLIDDDEDPYGVVQALMQALPSGSYLVITHPATDVRQDAAAEMARRLNARIGGRRGVPRNRAEVARFLDGLEVLAPGVVQPHRWRPSGPVTGAEVGSWAAVACKP